MNSTIILAPNGIFPITRMANGQPAEVQPATGFNFAGTIQGEGKMAGIPALFIRTAGCNLRCMWWLPDGSVSRCDTPYASFDTSGAVKSNGYEIFETVRHNIGPLNHIILTGGEPFIQAESLTPVLERLRTELKLHLSIETNGTLYHKHLVEKIDFFSISPKLSTSVPTKNKQDISKYQLHEDGNKYNRKRLNIHAIQQIIDHCNAHPDKDFQLKFVVKGEEDISELQTEFLEKLTGWKPSDVVLMPVGGTNKELELTRMPVVNAAIRHGWRYSPRLHVALFGGQSGV